MNNQAILATISSGESQTLEFKTSFQKEVIETVVAFANAEGGSILIGITDDRKIPGVTLTEETLKNWLNQIKNATQPSVMPDVKVLRANNKNIVKITVQEQPIKPVSYKNRYFKRIHNSNHVMGLDEIANEHLQSINASWDYSIDTRHDFQDISMEKVLGLISKIEKHRDKVFDDNMLMILQKYELIKDGKLTFAAYLLFVDNISAITTLQIGRFKTETDIID